MPVISEVEAQAKQYFEDVHPAHDWFHVRRVHATAEAIAIDEGADIQTVRIAALLHDIGRPKEDRGEIENHATWGATEADSILKDLGFSPEEIDPVVHCIRAHRYSTEPSPQSLEAKVLCDADNLDALGATGIARAISYGTTVNNPIADPNLPADADETPAGQTALNHLEKKILTLKDRMYTASGRSRAIERHEYVSQFIEQFKGEMEGRL